MKLVYTCQLKLDGSYHSILNQISIHASKFYNMTLYEHKMLNLLYQNDYYHLFIKHFRCGYLQKHTYIHAIKQAMKDVKSYDELLKLYQNNPYKNQKPGYPRFKHNHLLLPPTFLKTAIRIREGKLLLSIGKKMKSEKQIKCIQVELPREVYEFVSEKNVKMITVKECKDGKHEIKFVYEIKTVSYKKTGDIMSIDLGVKNLAAITFLNSENQYLLDGNVLKSKIATYNKQISIAYSKEMLCVTCKDFQLTKKLKGIMKKRRGEKE